MYTIVFFLITHVLSAQPDIALQTVASGFDGPVCIANAGDDRLFIVEEEGAIKILHADGSITTFMDIDARVGGSVGSEQGLLGLAFHPDYSSNGYFYVNYTNNAGNTRISRFSVNATNPDLGNDASEVILKTITQPFSNHNGGDLNFGPDGYLYVGMGDGGSGGDPGNRAQDTTSQLLGKMLRLNVDIASPYIPADNPYVGIAGDDEIWAYGLRNPWRFSFDRLTGDMWIGDVGQGAWEEVDFQPAASEGGINYGWRCYEGNHTYDLSLCGSAAPSTFPIYEYDHSSGSGGYAITGGYVYRGSEFDGMKGYYITCDFVTGNFWLINPDGAGGWHTEFISGLQSDISSFGEDNDGELYACNLTTGDLYRVIDDNCGAVWGVEVSSLTATTATVSWQPVGSPNYKLQYRKAGSPWTTVSTATSSVNLVGLTPSTAYSFKIKNKCPGSASMYVRPGSFTTPALKDGYISMDIKPTLTSDGISSHFILQSVYDDIDLQIISLTGNLMMKREKCGSGENISLEGLAGGIYIASFSRDGRLLNSQKLIIQ